ncbi:MAG: hypothetical protein PUH03_04290 [bacterium]|nr:hypothetical protein [bacterium]MDY2830176.1 hypothetical protein [Alphaproteobacteria bacterium]
MQQNKYIGDESFIKMLEHYACPTPLGVVKMRFAGAICSPNLKLRPTDVISSFWEEGRAPRLETKAEADLFFKFFMGLWDEIFDEVKTVRVKLPPLKDKNLASYCQTRFDEVEQGYVEGFFGGEENLKMPGFLAQIIDSLSELALAYQKLGTKGENSSAAWDAVKHTDKMVNRAIEFIIENAVLPRIEDLKRQVN